MPKTWRIRVKRVLSIVAVWLTLFSIIAVPLHTVQAAEEGEERITLSPAVVRPSLQAGGKATGKLTIINDGSIGYDFLMYARPFSVSDENYDPNYTIVNERTEAYQWVQFSQTKLRLEPGERVEVKYSVQTPPSARSGGHYAVLFAETQPPADQPASVARKKRVGSLLYMTVGGSIEEQGQIESWTAKTFQTSKPLTSVLRLKNTGNVHYEANISVNYTSLFGKKQFELNQQMLILPGTTRKVNIAWQDAPYFGVFKAGGTVSYLGKTETLPTRYVILMPISLLVALGVVVVLILGFMVVKRKRRNRKSGFRAKR